MCVGVKSHPYVGPRMVAVDKFNSRVHFSLHSKKSACHRSISRISAGVRAAEFDRIHGDKLLKDGPLEGILFHPSR